MAKVKVNFGDVQDFDALPEGAYDAVIEKIEYREPKEKGKAPYLNVEYTIVTDDEDDPLNGRKVWEVLSFSPKALFRMRDFFRAAGYEEDDYELDVDEDTNLLLEPDLTGEAVVVTLETEQYNKKDRSRVVATEFVTPPGDDGEEESDEDEGDDEEEESDDEEEAEEEEEEAPVPAKKAKAAPAKVTPTKKAAPTPAKVAPKAAPAKAATKKPVKGRRNLATIAKRTFR